MNPDDRVVLAERQSLTARELRKARRTRKLNLSGSGLTALPPEIGQLTQLRFLNLSGNQLSMLPAEIGQLTRLRLLNLRGNQLSMLPAEIGQLTHLNVLNLSANQLTVLPPVISQLTELQFLLLEGNQLSELPGAIGQLTELQTLHLRGNQLTALPPEIGQLTDLRTLDLRGNQLTVLPPEIGQLTDLRMLDITNNLLTTLPPQLGRLLTRYYPRFKMRVDGNPLRLRMREQTGRELGVYLQSKVKSLRKEETQDRWSSQDFRTFIITIAGTFIANVVTVLYVGLALVVTRDKDWNGNVEFFGAFLAVLGLSALVDYFAEPKSLRRRAIRQTVLVVGLFALWFVLLWVGKAAGIK